MSGSKIQKHLQPLENKRRAFEYSNQSQRLNISEALETRAFLFFWNTWISNIDQKVADLTQITAKSGPCDQVRLPWPLFWINVKFFLTQRYDCDNQSLSGWSRYNLYSFEQLPDLTVQLTFKTYPLPPSLRNGESHDLLVSSSYFPSNYFWPKVNQCDLTYQNS